MILVLELDEPGVDITGDLTSTISMSEESSSLASFAPYSPETIPISVTKAKGSESESVGGYRVYPIAYIRDPLRW